jgi:hypothetical protein
MLFTFPELLNTSNDFRTYLDALAGNLIHLISHEK